jgi:hypothetical protein
VRTWRARATFSDKILLAAFVLLLLLPVAVESVIFSINNEQIIHKLRWENFEPFCLFCIFLLRLSRTSTTTVDRA